MSPLQASLRRIAAIVLRQYYLMRSSPTRIVPLFAWVAIDIVLWGFIARYFNGLGGAGFDLVPTLLGAVLLWDFFVRIMHGVTTAFLEDVWSRNFLNVFATPLTVGEYVAGLVLTSIATSLVGVVVMLLLASSVFGFSLFSIGLSVLPYVGVLLLFGIALGIFACAMVLRLGPASEWLVWPIPALLSPFAAVFYPLAVLPEWMQWIARAMPPVYIFEGLRAIVAGKLPVSGDLAIGTLLALLHIGVAYWCFVRVYRAAVRSGLLARYSAESGA